MEYYSECLSAPEKARKKLHSYIACLEEFLNDDPSDDPVHECDVFIKPGLFYVCWPDCWPACDIPAEFYFYNC
jgi:hypothetical protein